MEALLDGIVDDLSLEAIVPLHRARAKGALCLACGGERACTGNCDWPPLGPDAFEAKLAAAVHERVKRLADEVVSQQPGLDVFGTKPRTVAVDSFKCSHCDKKVSAHRFAPHLERCMLGGGRASARIADSGNGKEPAAAAKRQKLAEARAGSPSPFAAAGLPDELMESVDKGALAFVDPSLIF